MIRNTMLYKTRIFLLSAALVGVFAKDTRVAGGKNAEPREFPYLASIKRISDNEHICGGAIISRKHVITSGQCVDENLVDIHDLIIRAGTLVEGLYDEFMAGYEFDIDKIFEHPEYKERLSSTLLYHSNLAIIRITANFEFNYSLNMIEMPTTDVRVGEIGTLSGWGKRIYPDDPNPRKVRKAWMMIVKSDICERQLDLRILVDQVCAFQTRGVGACIGDSGSPLVVNHKLVGIVSLFEPCATGIPDVFTRIYPHLDFIHSILYL